MTFLTSNFSSLEILDSLLTTCNLLEHWNSYKLIKLGVAVYKVVNAQLMPSVIRQ